MDTAKDIFLDALDREGADRAVFLKEVCGADVELRDRVIHLLRAHGEAMDFMAETAGVPPAIRAAAVAAAAESGQGPGDDIGPYHLLEVLGEGGFGKVFVAEQQTPVVRKVAIKILKPGMGSEHVIARFEAERQALALMSHPGIARIFDAGTTDSGQPYFVMEYVDGEPITTFCDRAQLTVHQRLELFEKVCFAVRHAHQKGIIHRDLKPTNVLVTVQDGRPTPKVIDFGIAKATEQSLIGHDLQTEARQLLGTPQYMSPEQAEFGATDVDTRADIYSLGVLMYELLTGVTPVDLARLREAKFSEIQRIIRDERAPRPSTRLSTLGDDRSAVAQSRGVDPPSLRRILRDDLDWVVLKALEKDRARRYETASELGADIRRYLSDEPVVARPPAAAYLVTKFVKRHRVITVSATLVVLAVIAGFAFAMIGRQEARAALAVAEERLWEASLAQARALRSSRNPGRRFESLEALERAAKIKVSPSLRNEAVACLTLSDVQLERTIPGGRFASALGLRTVDRISLVPEPGVVAVQDLTSGEVLTRVEFVGPRSFGQRFSAEGRYLVTVSGEGRPSVVQVWDVETGAPVLSRDDGRFEIQRVDFDETHVPPRWIAISGGDERVTIHELPGGAMRRELMVADRISHLAADASGRRLAIASGDAMLDVVDLQSGSSLHHIECPADVSCLAWSADGSSVITGLVDMKLYVWDAESGENVTTFSGHQGVPVRLAVPPSGDLIASYGWDNTIRLWNLRTRTAMLGPLRGWWLAGLGDRLVASRKETIALWHVEPGHECRRLKVDEPFGSIARTSFSPDGRHMLIASTNGIRLWLVETGAALGMISAGASRSAYFVPGTDLVVGDTDDELVQWTVHFDGDTMPPSVHAKSLGEFTGVKATTLHPDGTTIIVCDRKGLHFVDIMTGKLTRTLPKYRGLATLPSVSPDGRWLFSGTWKGDPARVWDIDKGEVVLELAAPHVVGAFSPSGSQLVTSTGLDFLFHEVGTWEVLAERARDNVDDLAGSISFSSDGRLVALARSRYEIELLDPADGRALAVFDRPDSVSFNALTLSPDGTHLLATTRDTDAYLWDLTRIRSHLREIGLDWQ